MLLHLAANGFTFVVKSMDFVFVTTDKLVIYLQLLQSRSFVIYFFFILTLTFDITLKFVKESLGLGHFHVV